MGLLERDNDLADLEALLDEARGGLGAVAVVRGEAGIGKTSLVRAFVERHAEDSFILAGACDDLRTPRPLGPVWDIAHDDPSLLDALEQDARHQGGVGRPIGWTPPMPAKATIPTVALSCERDGDEGSPTMNTITHHTRRSTWVALAAAVALLVAALATPAATASPKDKQAMNDAATGDAITSTFSQLDRSEDAVATSIRTSAAPGHAFTYWYVIFNAPDNCSADCDEEDVFIGGNPANGPDLAQIAATRVSVVYGGDGDVANPAGRLALDGGLVEGELPTGTGITVVIGDPADGALIPSPVTGLEDAQGAEIHVALQDHGLAHTDQALLDAQTGGFHGA